MQFFMILRTRPIMRFQIHISQNTPGRLVSGLFYLYFLFNQHYNHSGCTFILYSQIVLL